jgi:hypothetical protein
MTEQGFFSPKMDNDFYEKVGKIINDKFSHHIYDEDVVDRISKELEPHERTVHTERTIRNIISNRQLIIEHFL